MSQGKARALKTDYKQSFVHDRHTAITIEQTLRLSRKYGRNVSSVPHT